MASKPLISAPLVELRDRSIYRVGDSDPAVWLIDDRELGGVLVNAPAYSEALLEAIRAITKPAYLFLPSRHGAQDLEAWRAAGLETLAFEAEAPAIRAAGGEIDIAFNRKQRLSRTIDFLPMAGVTEGTCALRLKNLPGVVFFGPALAPGADGWPTLIQNAEDHSFEARLFGALGVKDLKFAYAFCDGFDPASTQYGPDADQHIQTRIEAVFDE
ncbi:conserved hypothetical protein [Thioalkalivibrio sp. K90mix]|uniref:hypothetical protein n=1 Tax=Thioalkalivibrio sp. (strain K90mix) TaxID=396595 RepID=UPI000195AAF3|nr:hypothetical protein [Thioalkalivibrio sp. K90mix]ADC73061.1 conserved hypothetical protein [Thioalkalivibrio sp. K90mix]